MPDFIDQTGHLITLNKIPERIISLVPSQTELLYDLGLTREVIGITKFCVYPEEWFRSKVRVGGTKQIKPDIIHQLQPDLIIANKEENEKKQVEELAELYPVWTSDVVTLADAYQMIEEVGKLTGKIDKAMLLTLAIQKEFSFYNRSHSHLRKRTACYLIWARPFMTVGADTFISTMLETAGFINVFNHKQRYPETTIEEIRALNPEVLLLSSEPFPFTKKHLDELQPLLPKTQIVLVNGEMFSWYGSHLLKCSAYFKELMYFT